MIHGLGLEVLWETQNYPKIIPIVTQKTKIQCTTFEYHEWRRKWYVYLNDALEVFNHLFHSELCVLPVVLKLTDSLVDRLFTFQVSCAQ